MLMLWSARKNGTIEVMQYNSLTSKNKVSKTQARHVAYARSSSEERQ
jgi:hypothetical protein